MITYCPKCRAPFGPYSNETQYIKDHHICPLCAAQEEQETVERLRRENADKDRRISELAEENRLLHTVLGIAQGRATEKLEYGIRAGVQS